MHAERAGGGQAYASVPGVQSESALPSLVSLPSGVSQPCLTRASWRCRRNCGHTALGGAFHVLSVSAVTPCFVTLPSLTQPFCSYSCADSVRPVVGLAVGRA